MARVIDLTLPLQVGMRGFAIDPAKTLERDGWNASTLHLYSHCGTHMDATVHFGVGHQTIDMVPLERCMGAARVAEAREVGPRGLIEVRHLGTVADRIKPQEHLLIRTDWSHRVNESSYRDELPRISEDLAHWCSAKQIGILGVEQPSVADVNNMEELTHIHRILFEGSVTIVEGLTNLDAISQERVTFAALPLKVMGGDGCPVRAMVIEQD